MLFLSVVLPVRLIVYCAINVLSHPPNYHFVLTQRAEILQICVERASIAEMLRQKSLQAKESAKAAKVSGRACVVS